MSEHADSDNACWDLTKRPCRSCEGYYRDIVDGLCRGCRGESSFDPDRAQQATEVILGWASQRTKTARAEAERYLAGLSEARRKYREGRLR